MHSVNKKATVPPHAPLNPPLWRNAIFCSVHLPHEQ